MQSKEYDLLYDAEERLWWFRALRLFLARLLPSQPPGALALDIGCGTGRLLEDLSRRGYRVVGLDFSAVALSYAAQRQPSDLVRGSADALPFRSAFDLVVSVDVLEVGTVNPQQLAVNAMRLLKPGGYGLFVMAAHQWLLSEHDRAVNSVRRYDLGQLRVLFSRKGAQVIRASYLFFFLFPFLALRKVMNRMRDTSKEAVSDVRVPFALINEPLYALCWLEAKLVARFNLPMGSSVVVLVRKNA